MRNEKISLSAGLNKAWPASLVRILIVLILVVGASPLLVGTSPLFASECISNVEADFSTDGLSVTAISDKGLSNVVLQFADGSEQKFEINKDGEYSIDLIGTGSNEGKTITGVWIKSGCEQSGDGSGYGEYIPACPVGVILNAGPDQFIPEPLVFQRIMTFSLSINQKIESASCEVTVDYATQNGAVGYQTATAGSDYEAKSGQIVFLANGSQTQKVEIVILPTGVLDPVEAFTLGLSNVTNAVIGDKESVGVIKRIEF